MAACLSFSELALQSVLLSLSRGLGLLCLIKLQAELADLPALPQGSITKPITAVAMASSTQITIMSVVHWLAGMFTPSDCWAGYPRAERA